MSQNSQVAGAKWVAAIAQNVPNSESAQHNQPLRYLLSSDREVVLGREPGCEIVNAHKNTDNFRQGWR